MTIFSIGYDGTVDEVQAALLFPAVGAAQYGVAGAGSWRVTAHPSTDKAVNVAPGDGWGPGVYDSSDAVATVQCEPLASGTRWDLITAKRDWQPPNGLTTFSKVTGGAVKSLPARLTSPGEQDEQPLALVQWEAGQTQPKTIVDLRCWAGNGGLLAKDDLVRSYLTRIGTEVDIAGTRWSYRLGVNDVPGWIKTGELGKVPLFGVGSSLIGGTPPADAQFLVQTGTVVRTTDQSGYARVSYPKQFPNGLMSITLTGGDDWANGTVAFFNLAGRKDIFGDAGYGNTTEFVYVMQGSNASGNNWGKIPNRIHRLNYTAIGW